MQTANLTVAFLDLPAGAYYDAVTGRLTWTPGPGQVGDYVVTALVGDGFDARRQTFTLRVVAEAAANVPQIAINLTPAFPVLPGQSVVATARADAWSGIATLTAEIREGDGAWRSVALDAAGRLTLSAAQPGLLELRITATDRDWKIGTERH